jgi:hypothetical protein
MTDYTALKPELLQLQTAMDKSNKKAAKLTQQVHDNSALLKELDCTKNELKNEINLMSKEMGSSMGSSWTWPSTSSRRKRGTISGLRSLRRRCRSFVGGIERWEGYGGRAGEGYALRLTME